MFNTLFQVLIIKLIAILTGLDSLLPVVDKSVFFVGITMVWKWFEPELEIVSALEVPTPLSASYPVDPALYLVYILWVWVPPEAVLNDYVVT